MWNALTAWQAAAGRHADAGLAAAQLLSAAERALERGGELEAPGRWHEYLETTGRAGFLEALPDRAARERWADTAFRAIRRSGFTLATMLAQRVARHPDRVLFEDGRERDTPSWTYAQVARYTRSLAAVFLEAQVEPRVAIFAENGIDGACADLACLLHGILVSPLNVHTDVDTLAWMFQRLGIDTVVTDSDERLARLAEVQARLPRALRVFRTGDRAAPGGAGSLDVRSLRQACAQVDLTAADARLSARHIDLDAAATVMFTSGSTGLPKGVVFSHYALVTKRFARHAALPGVGRDETLLCYLPLFHTFGRFLEMLGTIYWGGTYVFAGSPSADALIAELGRVRPTGLISIPVRWAQIREHCLEATDRDPDPSAERARFREAVGDRLRWGLSAAGYLDPRVFRFFQRHGVDLCSGFGMTEATGGITMTPPGAYVDGTVGLPLPGVRTRFGEQGELQIAGPYIARYLDEETGRAEALPHGSQDSLQDLGGTSDDHWMATGDLFVRHENGYLEIVDRIKDIYKNSRGQTVAPQRVEQRLASVPGVRRAFLAGDHRDHNVLLIVPDRDDPVLAGRPDDEVHAYLGRILASVNAGLAPYERAVNFAVLDRDFDIERDELTAKGTFRRKVVEQHFADVIDALYRSNHVDLSVHGFRVRIPRWVFRDLAILEGDVIVVKGGLWNRHTGARLTVARTTDGRLKVGDLVYQLDGTLVDLGLFARAPKLWLANPQLAAFLPCKPGWDVGPGRMAPTRVRLPRRPPRVPPAPEPPRISDDDGRLREAHDACVRALFGEGDDARAAVEDLADQLGRSDARLASAIRARLETLAFHTDARRRAAAYRVLLLDETPLDYDTPFAAFVESGRPFLDDENVSRIAVARHGERRLQALRHRLLRYRMDLAWPGNLSRRMQFRAVFRLLANLARHHPEFFTPVQAELACWALFDNDRNLASQAASELDTLLRWFDGHAAAGRAAGSALDGRVVFEETVPLDERHAMTKALADPTFLRLSLAHTAGEERFDWGRVAEGGLWVSPILSHAPTRLYRLGINLVDGRHFDLLLVLNSKLRRTRVVDTVRWMMALSCHPFDTPTLPRFGAWRRDLGAISVAYISDLTAWERIRELASQHDVRDGIARAWAWKKLFVRAMAAFFRAWDHSGGRIVPGAMTPANVALPDADFHETARILSLVGWSDYDGPLAFVDRLVRGFYRLTEAHYPKSRDSLQLGWIVDACFEGLGPDGAARFLIELDQACSAAPQTADVRALHGALAAHLAGLRNQLHIPLAVLCAVERFRDWERSNPGASAEAREEAVVQMMHLYRLDRFPDAFRHFLYQRTYFAHAPRDVQQAFDKVVAVRLNAGAAREEGLDELSELQGRLADARDREVFSRMVFPHARRTQRLELAAVGERDARRVVVRSEIRDDAGGTYVVREPAGAAEIGHLYRLILETDYPKHVGAEDQHLVVVDIDERVVGGLCYRWQESNVVYIDGIVVARALANQGIGGRLVEDFCVRMAAQGAGCVKTNFFLGRLFAKHGFQVNQRWGGLVRFLGPDVERE